MRILIAPDKFKGTLTATAVCDAIRAGAVRVNPQLEVDCCPLSDGGEGFVDTITRACGGTFVTRRVTGPLPEMKVDATFGVIHEHTAVIEMSSAAGLALLKVEDRNPLYTTTFGVGELIRFAVEMGCRHVLLGIGGSATTDLGIGALQACGCHIILRSYEGGGEYAMMTEPLCGQDMEKVLLIKSGRGSSVDGTTFEIACDVTNPLYGPNGSAFVFSPQKGASRMEVERLDTMLRDLTRRLKWGDYANQPGAGAAGGIAVGFKAMFGATTRSGIDLVMDAVKLRERIARADLVVTGEGKLDRQSVEGKTVSGVARLCRELGKPCVAIAGVIDDRESTKSLGLHAMISLVDESTTLEDAMKNAAALVESRAASYFRSPTP
jgi:glycerate kinase